MPVKGKRARFLKLFVPGPVDTMTAATPRTT
jgi:hypothetical protein